MNKKIYMISRIIIAIVTFIIFNIMFTNEDESWNFLPPIFSLIAFVISFPSSIVSKKLINIGGRIQNKLLKFLYYSIALPVISFLVFWIMYVIMNFISDSIPTPNDFASALGQALKFLFFLTVGTICIIVPYIQTLIVLLIKSFIKD